jgi:hypothetical protein
MALVEINSALFYSLHRSFIRFDLMLGMQTLLPTRNEGTRATCSAHCRKMFQIYRDNLCKLVQNVKNSNVSVVQLNECGLAM